MNFWLTVLTGISDPELVFGFHSPHVVMRVLLHYRPQDWADKVLKKTPLDLQKKFLDIPCVFQMSGSLSLRLSIPRERLSIPPRSRNM